jgi:hypothetical protein
MMDEIDVGRFVVPGDFDDDEKKTNVIIARPIRM